MNAEERAGLTQLIDRTSQVLSWAINDGGSNVPDYLRGVLQDAWFDVAQERFVELRMRISSEQMDEDLDAHGLSGPELTAKLTLFSAYFEQWSELEERTRHRRFRRRSSRSYG
jgi:hypothetical protein